MNWHDVAPKDVATLQTIWELNQSIVRARDAGAKLRDIAIKLGISVERVRQRELKARRMPTSPIEKWCDMRRAVGGILLIEGWAEPEEELAAAGQALVHARQQAAKAIKDRHAAEMRYSRALQAARAARQRA